MPGTNVAKLGRSVFTTYLFPFEITSALLVIAVVGAVVLARRPPSAPSDENDARPERPDRQSSQEQLGGAGRDEDAGCHRAVGRVRTRMRPPTTARPRTWRFDVVTATVDEEVAP